MVDFVGRLRDEGEMEGKVGSWDGGVEKHEEGGGEDLRGSG